MVENVGITVGIASPSVTVQKLFPLPVSWPTFELPMSANVGSVMFGYSGRAWSQMWGYPLESLRHLFPFKSYFHFRFPLPVSWPTFELPMSANVGQCRRCHIRVGHGRKCGGSRWNRFAISSHSKVSRLFGFRHLEIRTSLVMSRDQFYWFVDLM